MAKSGAQVIAVLKAQTGALGGGCDRALAMTEGDSVAKKLKITWTCLYRADFPPWKLEHRCYFCGPGCAEVGRAAHQSVLVNMQLSHCNVGDVFQAKKIAETGLSGISGAGLVTVFRIVCAISGNANLFCLTNMMQRLWDGFYDSWLISGTTLCILNHPHDWWRSLLSDLSQAVLTG